MKFKKLVCVDPIKFTQTAKESLHDYAEEVVFYGDVPQTENDIHERLQDADAVLVSWQTELNKAVIEQAKSLKYIGMACTLYDDASANVAVKFAREKGISVTGITDYGDPGVAEFVVSSLIQYCHGYHKNQFKSTPVELSSLKIGLVGLGATGKWVADCLLPFQPELFYTSRTRKTAYEAKGLTYLPLEELLTTVDVLSFHLPKNTSLLKAEDLQKFNTSKIILQTSLGLPFPEEAFKTWLSGVNHYAIFDGDAANALPESLKKHAQVYTASKSAGWSQQTQQRLSNKVLKNIANYLKSA